MSASASRYSVILPTYNERQNLPLIVAMLTHTFEQSKLDYEIVIVDDNSPDRTYEIAEQLQAVYGADRIVLLHRAGKLGLGSAYRDGLKKCSGAWIILMDADFSHHVSDTNTLTPAPMPVSSKWARRAANSDSP